MSGRVRFGVVGCGAIATLHQLPALRRSPEVELMAVVDVDRAWAGTVARRFGAPAAYDSAASLAGCVDAAVVATPNHTHADIGCALLAAGVHVLCEKPLATTGVDAARMFATAERVGTRLMAAHCLRFSPNMAMLQQLVRSGALGAPVAMRAGIGGPYEVSARRTEFRKQRCFAGGGVLVDLGVHLIDLAIWMAGAVPVVAGYESTTATGWEVETDVDVALEFPDGGRAVLAASYTHALDAVFTVRGPDGWASAPLYRPHALTVFSQRAKSCRAAGVQELRLPRHSMYDGQLAHFCERLRSGAPFGVRPEEVRAVIRTIDDCYARAA